MALLHGGAQRLQLLFAGAQALAHAGVLRGHLVDAGFERGDLLGQHRGLLVQLDVVGQQARALLAQPLDLRRDRVAAVGGLAELLLQAAHGAALAAVALFEAGQFGARRRVLFADGGRLAFELFQLLPLALRALLRVSARSRSFSSTAARFRSRCSADFSASRRRRSSSSRATDRRELARDRSSPSLRMS